jgi:lipopolysaccharide biosynthesis glycosyltransferase
MCVLHKKSYIDLLELLIKSIYIKANINKNTTDILIITSSEFKPDIETRLSHFDLPIQYYILNLNTLFEAGCARLNIFNYTDIDKYNNILYLDTDILINDDINTLFNFDIDANKLYALEEATIGGEYWGREFFDFSKYNRSESAFTSGILLFKNSKSIISLFNDIKQHINEYIYINKNSIPVCLDQPFIVYNAIIQNKYNNKLLSGYAKNNPMNVSPTMIIYHFPGGPGHYESKFDKMTVFWNKMNQHI